ncbi:site-specific integrase [Paenibacillus sp. 11B]|nr:site-specific integrase [Paenibacillus sp. 11B]
MSIPHTIRGKKGGGDLYKMIHRDIFSGAMEWKVIKDNPVSSDQKPKVISKRNTPTSGSQRYACRFRKRTSPLEIVCNHGSNVWPETRRITWTGRKHIDLETGVLTVEQCVAITAKLKEYLEYRRKEREDLGIDWNGGGYLFIFSHPDGKAYHQERPYLWFRHFLKKNNLRYIRFHDLRHTSATLLINQGVHAKIISELLGHGNISTTMDIYGHALQSADQSSADKFDSLFDVPHQFSPNDENQTQKPL